MIQLLHLHKNISGGTMSYTLHLAKAFHEIGVCAEIVRLQGKGIFAGDVPFVTKTIDEILSGGPTIITCVDTKGVIAKEISSRRQTTIVLHDYHGTVGKRGECLKYSDVVVIRKANLSLCESTFIPHPYVRQNIVRSRDKWASCRTRIAAHKNIEMIVEANRLLPKDKKVRFFGAENRMYSKFHLEEKLFDWVCGMGGSGQPREGFPMQRIAAEHLYDVDLTVFPGNDGEGSQYTFLEAFDSRAIPIVHRDWRPDFACLQCSSAEELAGILAGGHDVQAIRAENLRYLEKHEPKKIAKIWLKHLQR